MRKILAIALAAVMLTTVGAVFASADYGLIYTALKGTPVIDGTIDDIWNDPNLEWTSVEHPYSTETVMVIGPVLSSVIWFSMRARSTPLNENISVLINHLPSS